MRRPLSTALAVGAISLAFCGVSWSAVHGTVVDNPAAPVSSETGGIVSTTPSVISLIAEGMARSPTFAFVASQLLTSNVLATVEPNLQMKTGLRGYMVFVTRTPMRRYVRIYFDPRLQHCEQIAIVGHELQHALEVATHPEVIDEESMRVMYIAIGRGRDSHWDSDAAILAGRIIRRELAAPIDTVTDENR